MHDNVEGCLQAVLRDGAPRFLVSKNLAPFLSGSEVARPTSALYLVPDRTSPLFYMNSSSREPDKENFEARITLKPSRDFKGGVDISSYLGNPKNCVNFDLSVGVVGGTELVAFYRFEKDREEMED